MKRAFLTIDDSPSSTMKQKLDYLVKLEIPVIWFCTGEQIEEQSDVLLSAIAEGHIIANHGMRHIYFSNITLEEAYNNIIEGENAINELYQKANATSPVKLFRFPYGDQGGEVSGNYKYCALQNFLAERNYIMPPIPTGLSSIDWKWTYDVMEWSIFQDIPYRGVDCIEKVYDRLDEREQFIKTHNGELFEVMLLHDHNETAQHFNSIIDRLISIPMEFVHVNEFL